MDYALLNNLRNLLENTTSTIKKEKWASSALIFFILTIISSIIISYDQRFEELSDFLYFIASIFLILYLLSFIMVSIKINRNQEKQVTIEIFWKIFGFVIPILVFVYIIFVILNIAMFRNLISEIIWDFLNNIIFLIFGVILLLIPPEIAKDKNEKNILNNLEKFVISSPIIIAYSVIGTYESIFTLVIIFLIIIFLFCFNPPIIDFLLRTIHFIAKKWNYFVNLKEMKSKFLLNLKSSKKYECSDERFFWNFFIGILLISILYILNIAAILEFLGMKGVPFIFKSNLIFFLLLPIFIFVYFLFLLGFKWNEKEIEISIFLKYFTIFTIIFAIAKINETTPGKEIIENVFYLISLTIGISIGFTLFRKLYVNKIENYFSKSKFDNSLDYIEVIK